MIPATFAYERVDSVGAAMEALFRHGEDAKLLAGGHSLLPLMKLRLATPSVLIDISHIQELAAIGMDGSDVTIGALATHDQVHRSPVVKELAPLLAAVAGQIGDPQVRHRGTIGGSLAHGDPASDWSAALLAVRASLVVHGPAGVRTVPVDEFFTGFLETSLAPNEVLVEIRIPTQPWTAWSFQKFAKRSQDWAIVGVAVVLGDAPGVGLVNMAPTPIRGVGTEAALLANATFADASARVTEGTDPSSDLNATAEFRRHLVTVLTRRALEEAASRY